MEMTFRQRLTQLLHCFDLEEAQKLSNELHAFEAKGGELSPTEEGKWKRLTCKIQQALSRWASVD